MKNYALLVLVLLSFTTVSAKEALIVNVENFSKPFLLENQRDNQVVVLNSGIASFQQRLDLIRNAKNRIEVEYFIYSIDKAGHLFTQELIKAAKRGVQVRILVDMSLAVFELNKFYARELNKHGIKVRYYNDASVFKVSTMQFRSHRKLFSIDDQIAITGGRNLADEYYDLSEKFNFLDRDVLVEGPIVKTMRESFDKYWNHKIVVKPKKIKRPVRPVAFLPIDEFVDTDYIEAVQEYESEIKSYNKKVQLAKDFTTPNEGDEEYLKRVEDIARPILNNKRKYKCPNMTFASDLPGANLSKRLEKDFEDEYRLLRKVIHLNILRSKEKALFSSPYFIHNLKARALYLELLENNIEVTTYTNSLGSTDAVYVASNYYRSVFRWQREGMIPYIHNGKWMPESGTINEKIKTAKWGTHSKTHVYDDDTIMIGTYNIDNRSNFYNTEMAIFCRGNNDLAREVQESIETRLKAGYKITRFNQAVDSKGEEVSIYGDAGVGNKILMNILAVPSWVLSFLL